MSSNDVTLHYITSPDETALEPFLELLNRSFPDGSELLRAQLIHNAIEFEGKFELIYATLNDQIIGMNGFLFHDAIADDRQAKIVQSVSSATSPEARGRGVFSRLINTAIEKYREEAKAIIGFPNSNSEPIFVKKLGFQRHDRIRYYLPNIIAMRTLLGACTHDVLYKKNATIDAAPLTRWKGKRYHCSLIGDESLWGVKKVKQVGRFRIPFVDVGGFSLSENLASTNDVLKFARANPHGFLRFVVSEYDQLNINKLWRRPPSKHTEPLIIRPLNNDFGRLFLSIPRGCHDTF